MKRFPVGGVVLGIMASWLLATSAVALPFDPVIDFRTADTFDAAFGKGAFSASHKNVDLSLTVTSGKKSLWWDHKDGIGIQGGERDEINKGESLEVAFGSTVKLSAIYISDLFRNNKQNETGWYQLDNGPAVLFTASELPGTGENGEHVIRFDSPRSVNTITFSGTKGGNSFSVAGLDAATAAPEPGTVLLLSTFLGVGVLYGWRHRGKERA